MLPDPIAKEGLVRRARTLLREGRIPECASLLRSGLRLLDPEPLHIEAAGRLLIRAWTDLAQFSANPPLRVLLLGQCTTNWIRPTLMALGWGNGTPCEVIEGSYDNILQDLKSLNGPPPDVLLLLSWHQRLLGGHGDPSDESAFWEQVWSTAKEQGIRRVVQVGYDWVHAGPLGFHLGACEGDIAMIRRTNETLRARLPRGAWFIDLEAVSGTMGRDQFYDSRRYHWTKQPFSETGTVLLSQHLLAGIRGLCGGPKKVLALDLDNTLWGGMIGEVGWNDLTLAGTAEGEAFLAFQKYLKALSARGVLLAVCSKNNLEDAQEPFRCNPDMLLRLEDFAAFHAHWRPKTESLLAMAKDLNLSLNTFVFFDDSPAERELIRSRLPDVEVINVPEDPAEYVRVLQESLCFETLLLTQEDAGRTSLYASEQHRRDLVVASESLDDYLQSLQMVATLHPIEDEDMPRVIQLMGKTNQFNLTTRRHAESDIRELLEHPGSLGVTLRLRDRFSDHGLVGVLLAVPERLASGTVLRVDSFLMSCRVIGRTVEHFMVNHLLSEAARMGNESIMGEYIPTARNIQVANLWPSMGFAPLPVEQEPTLRFLGSTALPFLPTQVRSDR